MRLLSRILFAISVLLGMGAAAQTTGQQSGSPVWFKVANEGDTVAYASAVTVRYGVAACPKWLSPATPPSPFVASNATFGSDPCPNVVKELDVLETSSPQTVTVNGKPVTVPAQASTATTKTCTVPAQTFIVTLNADGSFVVPITGLVVTCK